MNPIRVEICDPFKPLNMYSTVIEEEIVLRHENNLFKNKRTLAKLNELGPKKFESILKPTTSNFSLSSTNNQKLTNPIKKFELLKPVQISLVKSEKNEKHDFTNFEIFEDAKDQFKNLELDSINEEEELKKMFMPFTKNT
ncbi:hypothetical protein A3Q56_01804 [Intoshia linei]|uniref:Uncharacterized protein n=1 Tax=Intoshia linei TaxID=1819745 RepID=A0A177B848_9BILA|nr:hypothetical protein A3Q56_01804 [Intoshia linei]